ncbi:DUF3109 family protein [Brevibacillus fulvus]|uniref:DUF3109 family protein n=1 Tax=Brevibacillus fulvus TaxID=1125967 RepID=A0A939BTH3_9BACL|nr:DUF3109 family protein [Brevibacillus fulvus]MBM7588451.1 hypothetical protein [Brevibacillus fulvus]
MSKNSKFSYYGTPDRMTQKEQYHCEKYIKRHRERLIAVGRYLIDQEALLAPFNLDCFHCLHVHRETCCENGQPYAVADWQRATLEQTAPAIAELYLSEAVKKQVNQQGIWEAGSRTPGNLALRHGSCLFYTEIDGKKCCSIHAYAEAHQHELYPLKPFSCQLYPLDLIQADEQILITAVTRDTAAFSRWGSDYLDNFYCASKDRRKAAEHLAPEHFAIEDYRPAYLWGLAFIGGAFGPEVAETLKDIMENHNVPQASSS